MTIEYPKTAQGFATPATPEEIAKESTYTNPNLHRRITNTTDTTYKVGVFGKNSYKIKTTTYSEEDLANEEIP